MGLEALGHDVELTDPRGRTPLELAVSLGHLESVRVLLRHNANVGRENANGWTVLQEAVSTGDPEMVQLVLQYRDYQRATRRLAGIPELLSKLRRASDFYVEMKWEFTSWVPLVSKVCPSDVYRVWKRGESLRVDTTLLGFEHMTWQRGRRSYIFKGDEDGAVVMEVDHDKQVVYTETLALALHEPDLLLAAMQPSEEHVAGRLTSPIVSTHLDTRNIAFERNKSGIWGWRSEKMEVVSGYEAKVYSASNVELVTKTRTEHLSDQDKSRSKGSRTPFHSFLGIAQQHGTHNGAPVLQAASPTNPTAITPEEYFDPHFDLETRNIGRPIEMSSKAVRLESARPRRVRYLLVVRPEEEGAEGQTALLGVDFAHEGATRCTLGMVLPLWSDTQVFLDGDGGFSVTSGGQTRIFKPISVQTMWAVLQELHRACEDASRGGHIPGGPALAWARGYAAALSSEQSCINEWLAMADLESVRPSSPPPQRPSAPELSEQVVRALLRDVMASADLESVTSKEVREELERRTGHSLAQHKDFINNEMLLVLAQMDRPSRVFPHLYLGSEWNAANLEELQQNRVTHILNVAREIDNFFPALFTYMNVRVYDEETAQLLPHWNDTFLFLSRVRASGGRALVHCRMGLSRSAATVLAYAMKEFGWSLERALRHVRHCRPSVLPNPGFMRQLDFYQGILHASRHSSLWEPKAAERPPQPEEIPPGDEGGLSPAPSPQPPEEPSGPGLLGASRRPRISLCAVMRSISQLESPEPPGLPGEPMAGEVFAAAEAPGVPAGDTPPGHRPSSRPRRVVRQASLDGGPAPDHAPLGGHAPPATCEPTPPPAP
ncbi:phosphatase Slingshot-like protein 3 isoform A [Patagioenas fasciata monilis]|uniref:protein-serine/threonine phosphatase n=1 Tax=Patagioenas fasciata monilis TaxID=372326 RepID=A0A1V4JPJ7_PATFA|nr:phosphatase Slingshot-like protein 3 isoform A [Patagioenas fasciata monilis]